MIISVTPFASGTQSGFRLAGSHALDAVENPVSFQGSPLPIAQLLFPILFPRIRDDEPPRFQAKIFTTGVATTIAVRVRFIASFSGLPLAIIADMPTPSTTDFNTGTSLFNLILAAPAITCVTMQAALPVTLNDAFFFVA